MRAALHLLLCACVLWCASGIGEPAEPALPFDRTHASASVSPVSETPDDTTDPVGEVHHHHCPIAPDLARDCLATPVMVAASARIVPRVAPLTSLTRAPPLQPPAAA